MRISGQMSCLPTSTANTNKLLTKVDNNLECFWDTQGTQVLPHPQFQQKFHDQQPEISFFANLISPLFYRSGCIDYHL